MHTIRFQPIQGPTIKADCKAHNESVSHTHLWNVDTRPEELQVFPHLLGFEFGVEDCQLSEHTHVCTLQPQGSL